MLKKIATLILLFTAIILIIAALLPSYFVVERRLRIEAPDSLVYQAVADLQQWESWHPYVAFDSTAKIDVSGPKAAIGQQWNIKGEQIGKVVLTHKYVESDSIYSILHFTEPRVLDVENTFLLQKDEIGTTVIWKMQSGLSFPVERFFSFIVDEQIGETQEDGLKRLKNILENK